MNKEMVTTSLTFNPKKVCLFLFYIALGLTVLSFAATILKRVMGRDDVFTNGLIFLFDATLESNVPTYFSAMNLLFCSVISFIIYKGTRTLEPAYMSKAWRFLSVIFLFFSIDEISGIHEKVSKFMPFRHSEGGYLRYAWIIPYGLFALFAGLYLLRFVMKLPRRTARILVVAGILYLVATIGFEPVEGHLVYLYGHDNPPERIVANIEEFLEMSAIIYFIFGMFDYLKLIRVKN